MDILTSIAEKIAELAMESFGREVGYLLSYEDNLKELKDQVEELNAMKMRIENDVKAEEGNGRAIESDVLSWQKRVNDTLEEVKKLCEDPRQVNVGCSDWIFPNLMSRNQLSRKAKKMANTIVELKGKGEFGDRVGYVPPLEIANFITTTRGSDKLESRNLVKENIVLSLRDSKVSKIGVFGLGGVGKTTLAKEVAKQVKEDKLFDVVVMSIVSQTFDIERVQDEIAYQLGLHLEDITKVGRADRLCERIKMEKSILIILDDVWGEIDLEKLGIPSIDLREKINSEKSEVPSEDDYKGCKLLFTSRSLDVLQKNDTQMNFSIQVLNNVESWSLFEAMVGDAVKDDDLQTIAIQVAQRCAGLPVLLVTIAKSLKNKDIHYWKDVLNNLESVDNKDVHETIFSALEFNFNRLEDEVKEVFLLCGAHGTSISISDLLKYVVGLGILKHRNTIEDARNRLRRIIDDLKASCLLLDGNASVGVIKMHDIVQEVAVSIASRDHYVFTMKRNTRLQDWPSKDFLGRCTQIILTRCFIQKLPERLDCLNLKFFHLSSSDNPTLEIPHSFFEGMGNLEALDLTGMIISALPRSLASLIQLKTLCLDQCSLKDMAGIGALINLEILSLIYSSIEEFPSEIGQLTHLRMLDLTNSGIEIIPPNSLSQLTKIEELYMGNTAIKWEVESLTKQMKNASLDELGHLTSLTTLEIQIREAWILPRDIMFEKLERYKFVIGDKWEWSNNKGTLRLLKLKLDTSIHRERGIKTLIRRVEDLYLDGIIGISNVLFEMNGEGFPLLKNLLVQNNDEIQHIINTMEMKHSHVLFPKLETLILHNLNNMLKICHGSIPVNSFGKLRIIKVKKCDQLVYLFSVSMVMVLSQLVDVEVSECCSMKTIVFVENVDSGIDIDKIEFYSLRSLSLCHLPVVDDFCSNEFTPPSTTLQNSLGTNVPTTFFNAKVKFSNLETLKLSSINLEKIWDDDHLSIANSIQNLVNLTIENCDGLKYLFSSSIIKSLLSLKQLEISNCDMIEEIIATEGRNSTIEEVPFSKLETVVIKNMRSLKKVWQLQFVGLKTLEVNNCEKLDNIFPSDMQRTFGSLETLKVSDCGSMEEIFQLTASEIRSEEEENVTQITQLKKLHLLRLPKLKHLWSKDPQGIIRFPFLQDVQVNYCRKLEYLFPFSIATDLLQVEKIFMNVCGMKKIVAQKEGPMGEKAIFNFQRLYSLVIWNMAELDGFYAKNHILACPSLRVLRVFMCAKLEIFEVRGRSIQRKNLSISMQQPLFVVEEVIPSLENLILSSKNATMISQDQQWRGNFRKLKVLALYNFTNKESATFVDSILQKAQNLAILIVQDSSMKEIFQDGWLACKVGKNDKGTRLKKLTLTRLKELQYICRAGCQIDPVLEVLEVLYVEKCTSLKILVPPTTTFAHMTYLEIKSCDGLINLIYSSTARSLVKLETMKIIGCDSLEEIVMTQEVTETQDEIVFSSLKTLELECLPSLNSFSSNDCLFKFPLLKRVVVRECPRMKIFCARETSTPMLRKVIKEGKDEEWCWEGDLNGTLKKICLDKVPFLEHLDLSLYPELKDSWYNPIEIKIFSHLKSLVVQKCDFLSNVLISSNLLRALYNLEELEVRDCESLEVLFEFNTTNEGGMSQEESINLLKISLFNLPKVQHIWRQDCQEIVSSGDSLDGRFQGLKVSKASDIGEKGEEEEVEIQHQQPLYSAAEVLFPNLEKIIIKDTLELRTIWHPFFTSNSISNLTTMEVSDCEKLQNIFPSYMQRAFTSLKELMVTDCNSIQVIFDFSSEMGSAEDTTALQALTLLRLSKLKQIWSRDPQANIGFQNLKHVCVEDCENLEYLLPFSIAMHAIQLEDVTVKDAGRMRQIVSDKEGPADSPVKFEFNHLTSLELSNLHELEGFFAGNLCLSCPSLRELDVYNCTRLKLFKTQYSSSQGTVSDDKMQKSIHQPLFTLEEVLCNLETLVLNSEDANMILQGQFLEEQLGNLKILYLTKFEDERATFPYWFLQNIISLQHLIIEWSSFKEIFQNKIPTHEKGNFETRTRLKKLTLSHLYQLQHICKEGFQIDPVLEVLEYLKVNQCSNLKHLVPSSINFSHLTNLEMENCNGLTHLITSTTARSLVKLTTMKIRDCNSLEHVVAKEREGPEDEIVFNSLEILVLERLPMIKKLCSTNCFLNFPLLENIVVKQCPRMKIFSVRDTRASKLEKIVSEEDEKLYWEGDINRTINKMFVDMVAFRNFKHLELSQYPELRELWYSLVQQHVFGNLKSLVMQKCDFLPDVPLPLNLLQALSNLEELQVSECESLEAVFDLTNINDNEMLAKVTIHLKTLTLSSLPKLKHIWKQNSQELASFDALGEISSNYCQGLQISEIQGFKETTDEEGEGDVEYQQVASSIKQVLFPNLETIIIKDTPELRTIWHPFFTSNSISNLTTMEVSDCEKLQNIFPSYMQRAFTSLKELMVTDCNSIQVIFDFSSEMGSAEDTTALQALTLLRLSKLKQIWSRDPQANIGFQNLKHVCVEDCENLEYLLPFSIAMHAIQLEDVTVKDAGRMRQIVSDKEGPADSPIKFEFNHLNSLELSNLHELEGFFAGNLCLSCPSLRELDVFNCARLKLFKTQYSNSQRTVSDDKMQKSIQQPLFTLEKVLGNLETLALNSEDASMILQGQFSGEQLGKLKILYLTKFEDEQATFPYWFLQNLTSLEHLIVEWSSFKEIFQNKIPTHEKQNFENRTQLKKLTLGDLYQLQHICEEGFQIDPVLKVLEYLRVNQCSNLKHLVPSSVNFGHLTDLEVQNCSGLTHLITSTTARSLVKLSTMKIRDCNSLEHVVAKGREEAEDEIAFSSLEILELECLPMIKSFCSTNCVLNLPLLEKVVVKQCSSMKIFSMRDTWTPTLEKVLTNEEDEEWCWEGDLNVTVKKIFQDIAIGEGDGGDSEESSRNILGISGASSFEEQAEQSKGSQIVDTGKQEIQRLPSSSADRQQGENALSKDPQDVLSPPTIRDAEESNHSEIHPRGNLINMTTASTIVINKEAAENQEMNKVIEKPLVQPVQNTLSLTTNQDAATGTQEMDENMDRPLFEAAQNALNSSISQDTEESHDSKNHPSQNLFSQTTSFVIDDKNETIGTREMHEVIVRTLAQTDQNAVSLVTAQNTDIETKEMYETIERTLDQPSHSKLSIPIIQDAATGTQGMDNNNERPLVEAAQSTLNPARAQDTVNLVNTTTSIIGNKKETIEAQDMYETIARPLIQIDQDAAVSLGTIQNTVIGTQEMYETIESPLKLAQNTLSLATIHDTALQTQEKYEDTGKPLLQATQGIVRPKEIQDTEESHNSDIGTQDELDSTMVNDAGTNDISVIEPKILSGENLLNQTTKLLAIENRATIDPSPSQPLEPLTSSILASDAYSSYKGMIDVTMQNMLYLEAGVKQHPQVLDWLNTKRSRVFASSIFSLFAEVTHLLRTTRRGELTKDDQNYIKECCTALQGVGFDESWISHVYKCIEECGDGEELKRKVEEAEGQVSNLKAQLESIKKELASVEASFVLLRDKASKLDNFIDSRILCTLSAACVGIFIFITLSIYVLWRAGLWFD